MIRFMAKRSHFYDVPASLLNITPKPDMLKISFFAQTLQSLCLLWMTKSYNNLTLIWVGFLVIRFELTPSAETR